MMPMIGWSATHNARHRHADRRARPVPAEPRPRRARRWALRAAGAVPALAAVVALVAATLPG